MILKQICLAMSLSPLPLFLLTPVYEWVSSG
jgi:hypothetical protein